MGHRDLSFGEHLSRWIDTIESFRAVSERTLSDYRFHAERYLMPPEDVGDVPLSDLTAEHLDSLYARLMKKGVGVRTINHVHATARIALQRATKKRLIPYNPAKDADPPRYSTSEREYRVLSEEEVGAFFEAAAGDRFEAFFVAAVLSGPRPAELRALAWQNLTLGDDGGTAMMHRTVSQVRGGPPVVRDTTKTGRGRSVPLLCRKSWPPSKPTGGARTKSASPPPACERTAASSSRTPWGASCDVRTSTVVTSSRSSRRPVSPKSYGSTT